MKGVLDPRKFKDLLGFHKGTHPLYEDFPVQQNGIDLRIIKLEEMSSGVSRFTFKPNGEESVMPGNRQGLTDNPMRVLPGQAYQVTFHLELKEPLPENVCAYIIGRSSFNRSGILIRSAWYDSGYAGELGATMYVHRRAEIDRFFRGAQILFFSADSADLYKGQYGDSVTHPVAVGPREEGDPKESSVEKGPDSEPTTYKGLAITTGDIDEDLLEQEAEDGDDDEDYVDVMTQDIPADEDYEDYGDFEDELDEDEELPEEDPEPVTPKKKKKAKPGKKPKKRSKKEGTK